MLSFFIQLCTFISTLRSVNCEIPGEGETSVNWIQLKSLDGIRFSARNAFAATVFKGEIWLTGGRSDLYNMYNMQFSFKNADVWHSADGRTWVQVALLYGDFYAQNKIVKQPGNIAPWYERFAHSMDALDIDGDGEADIMLLAGGYSPEPSNDIWITPDGVTWFYCGLADWSPRAWHSTTIYNNTLYVMGGSPLNNEVWRLDSVTMEDRAAPLTRAAYMDYSYSLTWTEMPVAPWSPRIGNQVITQWYFDESIGQTMEDSYERIILTGGFGGFLLDDSRSDGGFHTFNDVWASSDGCQTWTLLNENAAFSPRSWHGVSVLTARNNSKADAAAQRMHRPPRIYLFGGGSIGYSGASSKRTTTMKGLLDGYSSVDGIEWTKLSYEEGGGSSSVTQFSTQEWALGSINSAAVYIGRWGHKLIQFSPPKTLTSDAFNYLYLIGGQMTDGGGMSDSVFQSSGGLFCDIEGIACNLQGKCGFNNTGCECNRELYFPFDPLFAGEYCEEVLPRR